MQDIYTNNAHASNAPKEAYNSQFVEEIIQALSEHATEAQRSIEIRSEELQEAFLSIFEYVLKSSNVSRDDKIVVSLTEAGTLEVSEHPRQKVIAYFLAKTPQSLKIMQRLAADALLKRGLQYIKTAHNVEQQTSSSDKIVFQTSIKGDLSHFYLV